jgi:GT2 family glycosyltransferase
VRISLIILCHNKLAVTQRCLRALVQHSLVPGPWELIVVDNGSTDGTGAWLTGELSRLATRHNLTVRVLTNERNAGCSTARNQAVAAARGDVLVFLDNDVAPRTRDWLPRLVAELDAHPRTALAGPKLVYPGAPHLIQCAGVGISQRGHVCFRGRGEPRDTPRFNRPEEVQCLISACLVARAAPVRESGGFDEAFNPVQFEDFDLCYRLREQGWHARYLPAVEMYHFESTTTQGTPTMTNPAVVVRNGLTFQRRWRHMFSQEDGPAEDECRWRPIPAVPFDAIGELPLAEAEARPAPDPTCGRSSRTARSGGRSADRSATYPV